jgi:hypothetical protein
MKVAFTDAIRILYQACSGIAVAALLITLLLPEMPLRSSRSR